MFIKYNYTSTILWKKGKTAYSNAYFSVGIALTAVHI